MFELLIEHDKKLYQPPVVDGVKWTTERKSTPSKLTFTILYDGVVNFTEGDAVRLRVNNQNVFFGWIFTLKRSKENQISITCYDQLRYLKNKDTYVFNDKTATQIITMIANDFNLQCGELSQTSHINKSIVESNSTLFDMIENALTRELLGTGQLYVLYDDFGKITLKNVSEMKVGSDGYYLMIDETGAENYTYQSTIDSNTYDKIKLIYENSKTGIRDVYIAQDGSHINEWGVLQYFDTLKDGENGASKVEQLLKLYNQKSKSLKIDNAFGDVRVRGGSMIIVKLNLGDITVNHFMLVNKASHTFDNGHHTMSLNLQGGAFNV